MEEMISPRASCRVLPALSLAFIRSGMDTGPSLLHCSLMVLDTRVTKAWKSLFMLTKSEQRSHATGNKYINQLDTFRFKCNICGYTCFAVHFQYRHASVVVLCNSNKAFHCNAIRIAGRSRDTLSSQPVHGQLDVTIHTIRRQRLLAVHHGCSRLLAQFLDHCCRHLRTQLH